MLVIRFFTLLTLCSTLFISHLGFSRKQELSSKELIFKTLPISVNVSDDKGLTEQYDYFFLQVNPEPDDIEFTKGYKEYKF